MVVGGGWGLENVTDVNAPRLGAVGGDDEAFGDREFGENLHNSMSEVIEDDKDLGWWGGHGERGLEEVEGVLFRWLREPLFGFGFGGGRLGAG